MLTGKQRTVLLALIDHLSDDEEQYGEVLVVLREITAPESGAFDYRESWLAGMNTLIRSRVLAGDLAIHHIDGNSLNNDPANLRLVNIKERK